MIDLFQNEMAASNLFECKHLKNLILCSFIMQVVQFANSLVDVRNELQHKYVQIYSKAVTSDIFYIFVLAFIFFVPVET